MSRRRSTFFNRLSTGAEILSFEAVNIPNLVNGGMRGVRFNHVLGLWFICGRYDVGKRIQTSPDGNNWTVRDYTSDLQFLDVDYNINTGATVIVSTNGNANKGNFTSNAINYQLINLAGNNWNNIAYGGTSSQFFYASSNQATNNKAFSTTGQIFTLVDGLLRTQISTKMIFADGKWVFTAETSGVEYSTDNAQTFINRPITCSGIDFGNGVWVLGGRDRTIHITTDFINFTTVNLPENIMEDITLITMVKFCDGIWIFSTNRGYFIYSYDLQNFSFLTNLNVETNVNSLGFNRMDYSSDQKLLIAVADHNLSGVNRMFKIRFK